MAERKEELKSLLMKLKEETEKAGLKLNNQRTNILAYGPITYWQIGREKLESVFISLDSKITVDSDYSHEIKRLLFLGWGAMTNLDRDNTLLTKVWAVSCSVSSSHV